MSDDLKRRRDEIVRKHAVKLATKATIVDELSGLVRGFGRVESIDLAVVAARLMGLAVLAAEAEGVTREGLLDSFARSVAHRYGGS